jgi:C1A family cysteine protease
MIMTKVKGLLGIIVILALLIGSGVPFFASMSPAAAQDEKFQLAPLNPDFLDFLEHPPELSYGYVPPTMDLSHLKKIPVQRERALPALPSAWDWRTQGKVTPVKDQNPCGTCWIFGTTSVLESAVLIGESVPYDFSEQSVALCVDRSWVYLYDDADEPCGTVPGHGSGNSIRASDVFIKKGAVLETCNPYDTDGLQCNGTCACDSCLPVKKVTGYRRVTDDQSQIALIKNAVYQRPVTMSFFYDPSGEYTDPTYGAIYDYYPCVEYPNHLVSIIGWNDSVPHPDPDHSGIGAWLVKNSWGTGWGNSGYFWLAYNSSSMCEIAYLEYEDYNANETLYYYDEAGLYDALGYVGEPKSSAWMASVFTSGQDGTLTNVDFWTTSNNAAYEIYIYNDFFGTELASKTGSCAEFGYYSIPLTIPVPMTNGQQFTVAVKMTTPGFNYPLPVEYEVTGYCEPPIQTGVCFVRHLGGDPWEEVGQYDLNVCLRAKITTESAPNTPPEVTNVTASQGSGIVDIAYDVSDDEQFEVTISFEYWDGAVWQPCITTTGEGTQSTGTGKSGTWNAKTDFDEHYITNCKIRVTADDGQAENNIGSGESSTFTLDTKDPTGYGCNTPTNGATSVSINPNLTCLTASDDSPPISYYFQLAENDTFSLGLQESGWQSNATWAPSTLDNNTQYFWRMKAKDSYGNETDYGSSFNFTTEAIYAIPLFAGWNLISLPLIPDSTSIEDILAGINVDRVAAYDGATQEWYLYSPGVPSDLTEMTHGKGYWVKVTSPCTLTIEGTAPQLPYDIPLFVGWNLIGLPLIPESQSIEDVLAGISVDRVAAYDGATQEWYLYSPGAPSDLTEMTHGKGYWVKVSSPCTLTIEGSQE